MAAKIRVLIADDHVAIRQMLRATLESQEDLAVVGEASDGSEALQMVAQLQPNVVILDVSMAGQNGVDAAGEISVAFPNVKILMLTAHEEEAVLLAALQAGAHGFLLKSATVDEILNGVRVVAGAGSVLSPRSAAQLMGQFRDRPAAAPEPATPADLEMLGRLTSREREVLAQLSAGLNNREIGERLFISELTAKTHVQNLLRRLEVRDRFQAAALGIRLGIAEEKT